MSCSTCHPPSVERLSEAHVAVRFGDAGRGWTVLLDGEDITNECVEALAGAPGWAAVMESGVFCRKPGLLALLGVTAHVTTRIREGTVQIIRRPRPEATTVRRP